MPRHNKDKIIHGLCGTRFYRIWRAIKQRCTQEKQINFARYGGLGIRYCPEWENFINFKNDMYNSYVIHVNIHGEKNTSIDRIDTKGDYYRDNCRWATLKEQSQNRRSSILITFNGQTKCAKDWATEVGISYASLWLRLRRSKWSIEKTLTTPQCLR